MFYPVRQDESVGSGADHGARCAWAHSHEIQAAFDMPRYNAARLWRHDDYGGIKVGNPANLIVLDARSAVEAAAGSRIADM